MTKAAQLRIINTALTAISARMLSEGSTEALNQALTFWTAKQMSAIFSR